MERMLAALGLRAGSTVSRTFALMDIAEEALAARWPRREGEPANAFLFVAPTGPVFGSERLYRAHVDEMINRLWPKPASWKRTVRLTRAEVIGLLVESSLRHPLSHHDTLVYETLFRELWPDALEASEDKHGETTMGEVRTTIAGWLSRESPERASKVAEIRRGRP